MARGRDYISNELFHFVGRKEPQNDEANYQTLLKVLKDGCVSHPPHTGDWGKFQLIINPKGGLLSEELIFSTITCFADIPRNKLHIHLKKYGRFGVSFPRQLLVKYHARPVMYLPWFSDDYLGISGRPLILRIEQTYKALFDLSKETSKEETMRGFNQPPRSREEAIEETETIFSAHFLGFLKVFNSELPEDHPNNYYMEREWRKFGNLRFEPHDVQSVVVANGYREVLESHLPIYRGRIFTTQELMGVPGI
jgi:hypothetical protein